MKTTFIYALIDPRNGDIFYVGKSDVPRRRLKSHLFCTRREHNSRLFNRIEEIKARKQRPTLAILEKCDIAKWQSRERFWIKSVKLGGVELLNICDGGNGSTLGKKLRHSDETKEVLRKKNIEQFSNQESR